MFRRLVWRALRWRRGRAAVVFAALTVGAAIVCALAAVYFDIHAGMSRELRTFGANFYLGPAGAGGATWAEADFNHLIAGAPPGLVVAASPCLLGTAQVGARRVALAGVSFEGLRPLAAYWQVRGAWVAADFDDRNAMLGARLAEELERGVGDELTLTNDLADDAAKPLRVKGVVETGDANDRRLIVSLALAQEWLGQPGRLSHALLRVDGPPERVAAWAADVRQRYPALDAKPILRIAAAEGLVLDKIKGLMGLVALVILALATLCVNTALTASVSARAVEFALQQALGARRRAIVAQILAETLLTAAAAAAAGLALGWVLAQLIGRAVFAAAITFRAPVLPLTVTLALAAALLAVILPIRRALQTEPARILKGE
jgi:putative ABC transport system permease protein